MAAVSASARPPAAPLRPLAGALGRAALGLTWTVAATLAGVGWLYLLRGAGVLDLGPHVREALPLQRLAGQDAQPLGRLVVAWLPAGLVAGAGLRALGIRRRLARVALAAVPCLALLMLLGATADAITETEAITMHLGAQPGRLAIWVAAALLGLGAAA
jgi:hypothetical protein